MLRPYKMGDQNRLRSGSAGDAVFEQGDELRGIASWRQTRLAEANDGEWFAGWEMRESFFESASEMNLRSFGRDTKDRFAEAEDTVGGGFPGLRSGIACRTSDADLDGMM